MIIFEGRIDLPSDLSVSLNARLWFRCLFSFLSVVPPPPRGLCAEQNGAVCLQILVMSSCRSPVSASSLAIGVDLMNVAPSLPSNGRGGFVH